MARNESEPNRKKSGAQSKELDLSFKKSASFTCYQTCLIWLIGIISFSVEAGWSTKIGSNAFYTDDVALFSVTRRLSLKDDPTQPLVDRPRQGGDFVFEPNAELEWAGQNSLGEINMSLDSGGYVFLDHPSFTHGVHELELSQTFSTQTKLSVLYNFVPDLYLGHNLFKHPDGEESEHDEKLTSHYWSFHLDQPLAHGLTVGLLSRYGRRDYNAPFQHRDTQFWTLGPHIEWEINPDAELLLGYHYERGDSAHHKALYFGDDISYENHYVSAELKLELMDRLSAIFIVDYEKKFFTTDDVYDEHRGTYEDLYQGEIELHYAVDESTAVNIGWQYGSRKLSTEEQQIVNNNIWIGAHYAF